MSTRIASLGFAVVALLAVPSPPLLPTMSSRPRRSTTPPSASRWNI